MLPSREQGKQRLLQILLIIINRPIARDVTDYAYTSCRPSWRTSALAKRRRFYYEDGEFLFQPTLHTGDKELEDRRGRYGYQGSILAIRSRRAIRYI